MKLHFYYLGSEYPFMALGLEPANAPSVNDHLMIGDTWYLVTERYWFDRNNLGITLYETDHKVRVRQPRVTKVDSEPEPEQEP